MADTVLTGTQADVVTVVSQTEIKTEIQSQAVTTTEIWGGVREHRLLLGRTAADAHPVAAITGLQGALDSKVDKVAGKQLSTEDYGTAEKSKLANIEAEANKYTHPETHSADIIVDGTTNKAYTATEKTKLANIAASANNYSHPNHSGDVTSAGDGATTIANKAVTLAKMADMATASILGRNTANAGAPEVLSAATAKSLLSLNNVDNTSDANKPVSTAQQTALNLKSNNGHSHVTGPRIVDPEFSRASVAYDSALRRWEYNQRRWGANGTLIEEGTTNLLPAGSEDFVTGWTSDGAVTVTPNQPDPFGGNNAYRIQMSGSGLYYGRLGFTTLIAGGVNTAQLWAKTNNNNYPLFANNVLGGSANILSSDFSKVIIYGVAAEPVGVSCMFYKQDFSAAHDLDITVCYPQSEAKAYATSYTPPGTTRAAESLTIPNNAVDLGGGVIDYSNAVLNPTQGTIEMDLLDSVELKRTSDSYKRIFSFDNTADLAIGITNNTYYVYVGGNTVKATTASGLLTTNAMTRIALRYSGTAAKMTINGVTIANDDLAGVISSLVGNFYIGNWTGGGRPINSFIKSLRISSIARTDTELAYTGELTPDQYTTYFSPMKETISSRPYVVNSNGLAETVVTEVVPRRLRQVIPANTQLRAVKVATDSIDFSYPLPFPMQDTPAIVGTPAETTDWKLLSLAGVQTTGFTISLLNADAEQVGFRLTKTGHGLTDATLQFVTDLTLSAE